MAGHRDVQDFFELRNGFAGMRDFADAAIRFMDDQGIAIPKRTYKKHAETNGTGHVKNLDALREKVKRHYTTKKHKQKRAYAAKYAGKKHNPPKPNTAPDADGKHVTMKEAAKMLKMSEANVRLMTYDSRLPKPTYEARPWSKKEPDRRKIVLVLPVENVKAVAEARKKADANA